MLSPFRTPLQEIEGGELLQERVNVSRGHSGFDGEALGHARGDLVAVRPAIQGGPDERGRRVQLVNAPTSPVEHHHFTLDVSNREVGPWLEIHPA